jgi:hypothetical protein
MVSIWFSKKVALHTFDVYIEVIQQRGWVDEQHPGRKLNCNICLPKHKPGSSMVVEVIA